MSFGESDTRAKLIDPALHARGWTEELIRREERLATPPVDAAVKAICDIMRRSNCAGALQYVPELTWILFLRILDERETQEEERKRAVSAEIAASLESPFRWRDWAAPDGIKRKQLQNGTLGAA